MTQTELKRKINIAQRVVLRHELGCRSLEEAAKKAREEWLEASCALGALQEQLLAAVRLEEDLAGKNGPLVTLSKGQYALNYVEFYSKDYPEAIPKCRIHLSPVGKGHRHHSNIEFLPYGRSGDTFSDEDVTEVLAAVQRVPKGPEMLEYLGTWATLDTYIQHDFSVFVTKHHAYVLGHTNV